MNRNNQETGGVFWWRPAAWLRVTGEDADAFLQGQFTNDLRESVPDGAVYGLWLNNKGRVLADSFVLLTGAGRWWIGSYCSTAATIRERLESFIVADDVAVKDATNEWRAVSVMGSAPTAPEAVFRFRGRRTLEPNWDWVFPTDRDAEVRGLLEGARELAPDEIERRRILAGIPAIPTDIGPGELPNEGGLEMTAVSYTKGCYLGQEVMARLKTMGRVRRKLLRVRGDGCTPAMPADVLQDGKKIGEIRSVVADGDGFVGLALVSLLNWRVEAPLTLATGATVKLEDVP